MFCRAIARPQRTTLFPYTTLFRLAQAARDAEDPADERDVLAHDEHALVARHLRVQRLVEGLRHRALGTAAVRGLRDRSVRRVHRRFHDLDGGLRALRGETDGPV